MAGGTHLIAPTRNRPPSQPSYNHPPPRQTPQPSSSTNLFLRAIAITVLALILLTGLIVLITWLIIHPHKLQYKLHSASITGYNLTSSSLNSTFHFTLHAYNPNKKVTVLYDDKLQLSVSYNGNDLASTSISPFVQGHRNVTRMNVDAKATNVGLLGSDVWMLKRDRTGGSVDLDVTVKGKVRFKVGGWKSSKYKMKVLCSPVVIFSDPKRFEPTECDVDI